MPVNSLTNISRLGENVLLAGPVIRPCQERPNISGSNIKKVTGCDEEQLITELMKKQVQIPERSEGISGEILPCWMRFAPQWSNNKGIQYICFFCQCGVNIHPSKISAHEKGRRHRGNMAADHAPWMKETMDLVSDVYNSFEVDLIIISHDNEDSLGRAISLLQFSVADYVGVGFYIDYGKLFGLSLATERVCINIDSSVLRNYSLMKACIELRTIFEGSCYIIGADIWELMLVLFDHYRYRSGNMIEAEIS